MNAVKKFGRGMGLMMLGSGALCLAIAGACDGADETPASVRSAVTATFALSGTITGGNLLPVAGVTVKLNGKAQATTTTNAAGVYTFTVAAGSYAVGASLAGCTFVPDTINVSNLAADTTVNFGGTGATCGGNANSGATNGSLTISGRVTAAGGGVAGAVVRLAGGTQGTRTTGATGEYSFSVNRGSYSVSPSATGCAFSPTVVNLNGLAASAVVNFPGTGSRCIGSGGGLGGASGTSGTGGVSGTGGTTVVPPG